MLFAQFFHKCINKVNNKRKTEQVQFIQLGNYLNKENNFKTHRWKRFECERIGVHWIQIRFIQIKP